MDLWWGRWKEGGWASTGRPGGNISHVPQHSDSDSDPECTSLPSSIPSAVPVTGESFCDCDSQSEAFCGSLHTAHRGRDCRCGEEDECECGTAAGGRAGGLRAGWGSAGHLALADFDWVWDDLNKSSATLLSCDNRKVSFHMEYSCGTAAIRGTKELGEGQHFWEIKMTSPVYGTDMVSGQRGREAGVLSGTSVPCPLCPAPCSQMVGIGTSDVDLDKYHHTFCSLLGRDEDSWGLSYTGAWGPGGRAGAPQAAGLTPTLLPPGLLHHKGDKTSFSSRFGQGSIIGVHLDTWHGTLTFFKNRKCIGEGETYRGCRERGQSPWGC